ncbi:5667_t:CDS:1, partial [Acaulospora morrowiae]
PMLDGGGDVSYIDVGDQPLDEEWDTSMIWLSENQVTVHGNADS